ncbi:complex I subunit 4 family protein [Methylococcus capsulatus]|uniref:complex I subunit 4 family protein n=1 Tax=Methylococcus capsulatus TaxID=414 RepID=UPI001C52A583|nr:NADH-quinone oxidoreductase subunit M [Methylococcus capsulatus]QXP88668.1 NADH-quinone oxidoreductase subunit M [Methylococcus capsulatus]QXP94300.1 NADH-quinone oxidoreductase subunit M [Methylococcus capsulatus]UQN10943.1 NADH-quinone oxidoreductase subunit M [Methylococcus capsulatus]
MIPEALPLLSLLIGLPFAAALAMVLVPKPETARSLALAAAVLELLLATVLLWGFDPVDPRLQFVERHAWIPSLNAYYHLGVDGVTVLFPFLGAVLNLAVIVASWTAVQSRVRLYYGLILMLGGATVGVFCATDLMLFFLFWEMTIAPVYLLAGFCGTGPQRRYAAVKYALFMLAGGIPLLFAILLLALNHARFLGVPAPAGLSFDYLALLDTPLDGRLATTVFLLFMLGFAIKAPLFPFHGWLPTLAMEGPAGLAAWLAGLKLGAFGIVRFAVPLSPQAALEHRGLVAGAGIVTAAYGALVAMRQTNLRRLLAFSSISHVGLVVAGLAALNFQAVQGALFQLANFGIVAGGLFLVAGFIQHRIGSTEIDRLGGLARPMPLLGALFFLLGLASLGVPGTSGFAAEHLILIGLLRQHMGLGLAALFADVVAAAGMLGYFRRAFLGPDKLGMAAGEWDLRSRERLVAGALAAWVVILGLFPRLALDLSDGAVSTLLARVHESLPEGPTSVAAAE